jgi:hypothetical protein
LLRHILRRPGSGEPQQALQVCADCAPALVHQDQPSVLLSPGNKVGMYPVEVTNVEGNKRATMESSSR